jgi:hypothetical protein
MNLACELINYTILAAFLFEVVTFGHNRQKLWIVNKSVFFGVINTINRTALSNKSAGSSKFIH